MLPHTVPISPQATHTVQDNAMQTLPCSTSQACLPTVSNQSLSNQPNALLFSIDSNPLQPLVAPYDHGKSATEYNSQVVQNSFEPYTHDLPSIPSQTYLPKVSNPISMIQPHVRSFSAACNLANSLDAPYEGGKRASEYKFHAANSEHANLKSTRTDPGNDEVSFSALLSNHIDSATDRQTATTCARPELSKPCFAESQFVRVSTAETEFSRPNSFETEFARTNPLETEFVRLNSFETEFARTNSFETDFVRRNSFDTQFADSDFHDAKWRSTNRTRTEFSGTNHAKRNCFTNRVITECFLYAPAGIAPKRSQFVWSRTSGSSRSSRTSGSSRSSRMSGSSRSSRTLRSPAHLPFALTQQQSELTVSHFDLSDCQVVSSETQFACPNSVKRQFAHPSSSSNMRCLSPELFPNTLPLPVPEVEHHAAFCFRDANCFSNATEHGTLSCYHDAQCSFYAPSSIASKWTPLDQGLQNDANDTISHLLWPKHAKTESSMCTSSTDANATPQTQSKQQTNKSQPSRHENCTAPLSAKRKRIQNLKQPEQPDNLNLEFGFAESPTAETSITSNRAQQECTDTETHDHEQQNYDGDKRHQLHTTSTSQTTSRRGTSQQRNTFSLLQNQYGTTEKTIVRATTQTQAEKTALTTTTHNNALSREVIIQTVLLNSNLPVNMNTQHAHQYSSSSNDSIEHQTHIAPNTPSQELPETTRATFDTTPTHHNAPESSPTSGPDNPLTKVSATSTEAYPAISFSCPTQHNLQAEPNVPDHCNHSKQPQYVVLPMLHDQSDSPNLNNASTLDAPTPCGLTSLQRTGSNIRKQFELLLHGLPAEYSLNPPVNDAFVNALVTEDPAHVMPHMTTHARAYTFPGRTSHHQILEQTAQHAHSDVHNFDSVSDAVKYEHTEHCTGESDEYYNISRTYPLPNRTTTYIDHMPSKRTEHSQSVQYAHAMSSGSTLERLDLSPNSETPSSSQPHALNESHFQPC